jgi:hypothetical protein
MLRRSDPVVFKVAVNPNGSWNIYAEHQTSLIYNERTGAAVKNSYRFNVSYSRPIDK